MLGVSSVRTEDKDWLLAQIYQMTNKRFRLVRHLVQTKPWDFCTMVEMGVDRIHHGLWRFYDPEHREHVPNHKHQHVIRDYYRFVDQKIGSLLGGYYGRLFINLQGRESLGIVPSAEYESLRDELIQKLNVLPDPNGQSIQTRIFKPQDLYAECRNIPPDLIIYFGNLYWWSVGSVGLSRIHIFENDTGPDKADHAHEGIFIMKRPSD